MKSIVSKVLSVALLISAVPGFAMQAPAKTFTQKVKDVATTAKTKAQNAATTVQTKAKNAATTVKNKAVQAKNSTVDMLKPVQKFATEAEKQVHLGVLALKRDQLKEAANKADAKLAAKFAYYKNTIPYKWATLKANNPTRANVVKYSTIAVGTAAAAGLVALSIYGIKKAYDTIKSWDYAPEDSVKNNDEKKSKKTVTGSFNAITAKAQELMKNQNPNAIMRSERLWNTAINQSDLQKLDESSANALFNAVIDFDNAFRTETTKRAQEIKQAYEKLVEIVNVCNALVTSK